MTVSFVPLSAASGLAAAWEAGAAWPAPVAAGCPAGAAGLAASAGFGATVGAAVGLDGRQAASRVAALPSAARVRNRRRVRAPAARSAAPPCVRDRGAIENPPLLSRLAG